MKTEKNRVWNFENEVDLEKCGEGISRKIMAYSDEIRSAVLVIHGENAHSRYFGEDAFKRLTGDNKELLIVPDASHVDLYDNMRVIPFDRMERFFKSCLK